MRDLENMLQGLGEKNKKAEQEEITMTDLEKKRIFAQTMTKIEQEKVNENRDKKNRRWRTAGKAAAAVTAVVLVGIGGTKAAAALGLDDSIRNFFHIEAGVPSQKIEKMVSTPEASTTNNGVSVSTSQVIGDTTRFYAVLKVKNLPEKPEKYEFQTTELAVKGDDGATYDYTIDGPNMAGGDGKTTTFNVLVSGINKQGVDVNLNGKSVAFTLKNIGYRDAKGKFKVVKKGNWKLDWTFKTEADVTTKEVNKNISLLDAKATWKDIRISPLSVTVDFQITKSGKAHMSFKEWNKLEKTQRVVVQFADGTREDSRFCDDVNEEWGDEKTSGYRRIGFRKVIEPKDIVSVTFGDQTVVLNPNVKLEQRTKLRSKAANCTVALPQNVAKLITVKEKKNVKNADFKKKESYAMFMAKKNGVKMPFFTIHKIKGEYSPEQVEKKNDTMTYIDSRDGDTYTIEYGEIMDEKQAKEFKDILNTYISNVLPYFEIIR